MRVLIFFFASSALFRVDAASAGVDSDPCREAFLSSTADVFSCTLLYKQTSSERTEMEEDTGGILRSLHCALPLRLSKSEIVSGLLNEELIDFGKWEIACDLSTNGGDKDVIIELNPEIRIEGETVTQAMINISRVRGLPAFVGKLLMKHANDSEKIREELQNAMTEFLGEL